MNHSHTFTPLGPSIRSKSAAQAKPRNEVHLCKARGCNHHREGLNAYCASHNSVYRKYGHPSARPIKPIAYTRYRKEVSAIFDANAGHAGLVAALDYIDKWTADAANPLSTFKGAPEVARLASDGITTRDILIEASSFWCFLHDNPRALPDTRSEDFGLSRAVMHLAPRPRRYTHEAIQKGTNGYQMRPKFSALNCIGSHLRAVLAFFLANIAEAVSTRDTRELETLRQLRAPLASPTAVYLVDVAKQAAVDTRAGRPYPLPFS